MGVGALVGSRVSLRAIRADDLAGIEAWFEEAVLAAGSPHPRPLSRGAGEGRSIDSRASDVLVVARVGEDGLIGLVEYEVRDGWMTIGLIALAKPYRGWGYGSEAMRLLEDWAARKGLARRFRAGIDVRNGLGLYFWLRLGYRPADPDEAEWPANESRDMMPMVRVTDDARM